jgi:hypothetical protein
MVSGKLCCGVNRTGILIRIAPEMREQDVGAAPCPPDEVVRSHDFKFCARGAGRLPNRCCTRDVGSKQPLPEEMFNCGVLLASL